VIRSDSSASFVPVPRRADPPSAHARGYLHRLSGAGSISPAAVSAIAAAITVQEGNGPATLATRNNNPGNLIYVGQAGATQGAGGFAAFSTPAAGQAALENQITLDATRGTDATGKPTTTVAELITSWAPPSSNNTAAYIASVQIQTGYDPNAPLSSLGAPDASGTVVASTFDGSAADDTSGAGDSFSLPDSVSAAVSSFLPADLQSSAVAALAGGLLLLLFLLRR
jgi:hypothetical protein